ncbi:MAG: hypothetical protein JJT75_12935 [Opitutales bacterium]|nr:hypothetical protein [Opitutales bacterium]MCH8540155.1 hypothetical protein [Opitutales bacterium]
MNIPKYWAKEKTSGKDPYGRPLEIAAWGWSSTSEEEARQVSRERAQKIFAKGFERRKDPFYDYGETPLREEVLDRYHDDDEEYAVLTRNRYGALVLNTAKTFFLDIDFPPIEAKGVLDFVLTAFSRHRRAQRENDRQKPALAMVREWFRQNPGRSARIYRTKAGLRLLFTDRTYDPEEETVPKTFEGLDADPLYQQLTKNQKIFRARVSPKPWRIALSRLPGENSGIRERAEWMKKYHDRSSEFSVVQYLETIGSEPADPRIAQVVRLHDSLAMTQGKPLA